MPASFGVAKRHFLPRRLAGAILTYMDPRTVSTRQFRDHLRKVSARLHSPVAGWFGPGSLTWKLNREVVLHAAGPRALLMQLAHPAVARGVSDHSNFRTDPYGRAIRTFVTVYSILFGTRDEAVAAAARVHAIHAKVHGRLKTSSGRHARGDGYSANDPNLLRWVFATLVDSAILTYDLLVHPMTDAEKDGCYQEIAAGATLFGLSRDKLPATWPLFQHWLEATIQSDEIVVSPTARELGHILLSGGPLALRPLAPGLRIVTAGLLHPKLRTQYGLGWGIRTRLAYGAFVRTARATVRHVPGRLRQVPMARSAERRCQA